MNSAHYWRYGARFAATGAASLIDRSHAEYRRLLCPRINLPIHTLSAMPLKGIASATAWFGAKRAIDRFRPDVVIHSEAVPLPLRFRIGRDPLSTVRLPPF